MTVTVELTREEAEVVSWSINSGQVLIHGWQIDAADAAKDKLRSALQHQGEGRVEQLEGDPNDECRFCPHRGYEHSRDRGECMEDDCDCDTFIAAGDQP